MKREIEITFCGMSAWTRSSIEKRGSLMEFSEPGVFAPPSLAGSVGAWWVSVCRGREVKHQLENPGKTDLALIDVRTGIYLGYDDIVRF